MNRRRRLMSNQLRMNDDEFDILDILSGDTGNEPDEKLGNQQRNGKITRMLARLSLEHRLVVEFKVFQSLTFDEIAVMQDISANTVKTRFYTALKKLKAVSEENNVLS